MKCIEREDTCDEYNQCGDGSDESSAYCENRTCLESEFPCDNGRCVQIWWRGDDNFLYNCDDHTDEIGCCK